MRLSFGSSLRAKIMFPLAIVMIAVGALASYKFGLRMEKALLDEFGSKGRALAASLASSAQGTLLNRDASTVQGFIDEYKGIHGVGYVYVVDGEGAVVAHTFIPAFPDDFGAAVDPARGTAKISQSERVWKGRRYLDIQAPILAGTLGYAHVGMDLGLAEAAGWAAVKDVLSTVLVLCLLGFGSIYFLLNHTIRQVIGLSELSHRVAGGNFDTSDTLWSSGSFGADEIGVLARNFFQMILQLRFQRRNLEEAVKERTRKLSETNARLAQESRFVNVLQKSAVAANEAATPEDALRSTLSIVANTFAYSLGHVFLCKNTNGAAVIESSGIYLAEDIGDVSAFIAASREIPFAAGMGLPGQVLKSGRVAFVHDISASADYPRYREARALGLKGGIAVPVLMEGQVVAIMELFSCGEIDLESALENVLANVGTHVGRVFERAHAKSVVEEQRAQLVAASKMSSLGEMAGGVAHEINNPLAIINSLGGQVVELLQDDPLERDLLIERARKIGLAADRIAKIVSGLRTFSRDGSRDPFQIVGVKALVEETLSFCSERLRKNGVALSVDPIPENLTFEGRATQISQVLVNLLQNADDATSKMPDRWIRLSTLELPDGIEFRVTDCGNGLSKDVQKKLFQPFFTTKEIGKGTGMGLSISLGIMRSHQGDLALDTACANTCFVLRLPKRQSAKAA